MKERNIGRGKGKGEREGGRGRGEGGREGSTFSPPRSVFDPQEPTLSLPMPANIRHGAWRPLIG